MGWKTFKDHFGITRHTVEIGKGKLRIGSGFIPDLVLVDLETGALEEHETFPAFLAEAYPALKAATDAERLALLQALDQFSADIPVFTYQGAEIIEKRCETPGYPNATHDGELMMQNTFSTDREKIIATAMNSARLGVRFSREYVEKLTTALAKAHQQLEAEIAIRDALYAAYPNVSPTKESA